MQDLTDKVVLVTGAAGGIGRATALAFAREGASPVAITDINEKGLQETAGRLKELGTEAIVWPTDVTDFVTVNEMVEDIIARCGRIDVLVNVAGISLICPAEKLTIEDWKKVVDVDLWGVINTVTAVYPHMVKRRSGHIVNTSSTDGLFVPALYYSAPYCTAKFGVVGLSEALLYEAMLHNIGVTVVGPGVVDTPIFDATPVKGLRPEIKELLDVLAPRKEDPEDTARAIVNAVKKNRFMVVTTMEMKILYFLRRHFQLLWFPFMKIITKVFDRMMDKYRS
jgi:NAD(P)-dependent dehydrogenase (short-subunit alcohol dehydrogenase family)